VIAPDSNDIRRVWWIDPGNFLILVTLPVFVVSALLGGPLMTQQFSSFDFLTNRMIGLGVASVCVMAIGGKVGSNIATRNGKSGICFHWQRYDQFLVVVLAISVAAHLMMLGSLLLHPSLVLGVLRGEKGQMFAARDAMERIVGLTSLTNVAPLFWSMCAVRFVTRGSFYPSQRVGFFALGLAVLILVHAFIGSERLVILLNGIAFALPLFSFVGRLRRLAAYIPLVGAVAVVLIFAAGEYMRSWAYYQDSYDSFAQFAGLRLLAYVAVASNTGAGLVSTFPPVGYPLLTGIWFFRLTGIADTGYAQQFFTNFGNPEFNNPSGIFAPIVDFGTPVGLVYLFVWGLLLGSLYGLYRRKHPVGLLAYPLFYIGLADLTQIWYWGQPPFIPQLLFLIAAITLTVRRPVQIGGLAAR
jgi:hypothetical protein